ncbi:hypothetical protein EPN95_00545 [Patescibacteria group bacterium]|nr:MAG: hypothetical protein EPN95_00545 [Patescibacteria group bacterium]
MFKAYKKFRNQKITDVRRELARAHLIIGMLSFVTIVLLLQEAALLADLNTIATTLAIILLAIVAVISLVFSITLFSLTKKK